MGIAINLYWNNPYTQGRIHPGKYDRGIVLYKMDPDYSYDLEDNKIFSNRFTGYDRGPTDYTKAVRYYRDEPVKVIRPIYIIIVFLVLAFLYVYKRK
jgi:hypothetical protein